MWVPFLCVQVLALMHPAYTYLRMHECMQYGILTFLGVTLSLRSSLTMGQLKKHLDVLNFERPGVECRL